MFNYPRYKIAFFIHDIIALSLLFIGIYALLGSFYPGEFGLFTSTPSLVILNTVLLTLMCLFIFRNYNLYQIKNIQSSSKHLTSLIKALITFVVLTFIIYLPFVEFTTQLVTQYLVLFILFLGAFYILRVLFAVKIYERYGQIFRDDVLIVGDGERAKVFAAKLFMHNTLNLNILGFISDERRKGEEVLADNYVLGNTNEMEKIVNQFDVDEILLNMDNVDYDTILEMLDRCNRLSVRVRLSSKLFRVLNENIDVEKYYEIPVLEVNSNSYRVNYERFKRVFDIVISSIMLIIASPLLIFTSILIKVTSKGPVIFSQRRIGKNGKPFDFYKFRSMIHNGKKDSEREKEFVNFINDDKQRHNYKVLDEDKVTRVGKIIRKTSIDELPQLFNVIKGDMSLVGPRPCLPYEFNHYQSWQRKRVEVMPGCTGLWQVFGRNSVSFVDSMKMDIYYIYKMSFLTDLEYMIKTIPVILLAKGE